MFRIRELVGFRGLLIDYFEKILRFLTRCLARCGKSGDANSREFIAAPDRDLIAYHDCMSRFGNSSVHLNEARVAQLLSNCPAQAQAARFEE